MFKPVSSKLDVPAMEEGVLNLWQREEIFKKTVERLLPKENIYRRKEGFSIPIKHWLRVELRDMMEAYLGEKRISDAGLFNPAPVRAMVDAHVKGRENYSHQLWALMVFHIWKDNYLR